MNVDPSKHALGRTQQRAKVKTSAQLQETIVTKSHFAYKGQVLWLALPKPPSGDNPDFKRVSDIALPPGKALRYSLRRFDCEGWNHSCRYCNVSAGVT